MDVSAHDLARDLADRCESLFERLIADASKVGHEMRGHAPDGGVVSMALTGRKRGRWSNWQSDGQSGDALDFVAHMQCGGDLASACRWARDWLGKEIPMPAADRPKRRDFLGASTTPLSRVRQLWADASDGYRAPIASYLSFRLGHIVAADSLSPAIRYHPHAWHARDTGSFPAMLAVMHSLEHGQHVATHVTYLAQQAGGWRKAPLVPVRKIFGSFSNAVIPLAGRPREIESGEPVLIGEGIENVLAAQWLMQLRDMPRHIWAAASLGNLGLLSLPKRASVTLVRDNDDGNEAATRMFQRAIASLVEQGCAVDTWAAPAGFSDMADYVSRMSDDDGL